MCVMVGRVQNLPLHSSSKWLKYQKIGECSVLDTEIMNSDALHQYWEIQDVSHCPKETQFRHARKLMFQNKFQILSSSVSVSV
jgi:hypothetical protein